LNQPELVFLDEPTSGLDPLGRLLVRDIIRELKRQGTAVFLNSHLLGEVEATCDRVVFVKAGRTVHELELAGETGGIEVELRTGPLENGTLEALACFGTIEPAPGSRGVTGGASDAPAIGSRALGVETRLRICVAEESALPQIARLLVERGIALYEMKTARKSLEAWFLEVMGEDQGPG
jgi:ABC-2 type transport system ATP-binding protein